MSAALSRAAARRTSARARITLARASLGGISRGHRCCAHRVGRRAGDPGCVARAQGLPASAQWIPPWTPQFIVWCTVPQIPTIQLVGVRNPGFSRAGSRTPPPSQGNPTTSGVSHTSLTKRGSNYQEPLWVCLWGAPKPATTKWAFSLRTVARCLGISGLILG